MKNIFITIISLLRQIPEIHVDMNKGQLYEEGMPSIALPCVLVEISYPSIEEIDQDTSDIEVDISLKVAFDRSFLITDSTATLEQLSQSLSIFDTIDSIDNVLQGYEDDRLSPLSLHSSIPDTSLQGIYIQNLRYTTSTTRIK